MKHSGFHERGFSRPESVHPGFQLMIERGVSNYPVRPVIGERYLIGAGSNCQLQLGGEIPLLHSIIIPEGDHLWIDAVSPTPPLFVNGQHLREGELNRGDVIAIGDFVFCVDHRLSAPPPPRSASSISPSAEKPETGERTAGELIEFLEKEMVELAAFEAGQRQATASLQQAAIRSGSLPPIEWSKDPRATLLDLLAELHDRSRALDVREAALNERAQRLAESQEELRRQLDTLCRQQQLAGAIPEDAEHRKSA